MRARLRSPLRPRRSRWLPAVARLLAAALPAFALACAPAPESAAPAADLAAIAEFNRDYLAAINTGDLEALAALTTADHMMISSGAQPLVGKEALVTAMAGAFERFAIDESWTPEETVVAGDLAYQRGSFVVEARPKSGGAATRATGNFLRIYRRQDDGAWFMVRDMHNSDGSP